MNSKSELRKFFLNQRLRLSNKEVQEKSIAICKQVSKLDLYGIVSVFLSLKKLNEVETNHIINKLQKICEFTAPKIIDQKLIHIKFNDKTTFIKGKFGVREVKCGKEINPELHNFVLVPLLICDIYGTRIGYGKGYYDRFLAECNHQCKFIGLSFYEPIKSKIERNKFDIQLDCLITPLHTYLF